jgi:hypothetical protein
MFSVKTQIINIIRLIKELYEISIVNKMLIVLIFMGVR